MAGIITGGGFRGLEIGVFSPETPLMVSQPEIKRAAGHPTDETFLRRVRFHRPREQDIHEFLNWGDDQMTALAKLSGGVALEHTWGLYDATGLPECVELTQAHDSSFPCGYILAAEVRIIEPALTVEPAQRIQWVSGVNAYRAGEGPRLTDTCRSNFTVGTQRGLSQPAEDHYILHDIELWPVQ